MEIISAHIICKTTDEDFKRSWRRKRADRIQKR